LRGLSGIRLERLLTSRQKSPDMPARNAVLLGVDGRSDFNGLHSRKHDTEVEFYAFDILVSDGEDLRGLPLWTRKASPGPASGTARRRNLSDCEQGEIGPDLFQHACLMGLEGLVSKHRESTYRGGRSPRWIKVKYRHSRGRDQFG
jgi:bifunctional non-homologous end joining protein LigD